MAEAIIMNVEGRGGMVPGDVICIREDGFEWGPGERDNPIFRIVRLPMSVKDAAAYLCAPEAGSPTERPIQSRIVRLRLEDLPKRVQGRIDILSRKALDNARRVKPPIRNPFIVGRNPFEVG